MGLNNKINVGLINILQILVNTKLFFHSKAGSDACGGSSYSQSLALKNNSIMALGFD